MDLAMLYYGHSIILCRNRDFLSALLMFVFLPQQAFSTVLATHITGHLLIYRSSSQDPGMVVGAYIENISEEQM